MQNMEFLAPLLNGVNSTLAVLEYRNVAIILLDQVSWEHQQLSTELLIRRIIFVEYETERKQKIQAHQIGV